MGFIHGVGLRFSQACKAARPIPIQRLTHLKCLQDELLRRHDICSRQFIQQLHSVLIGEQGLMGFMSWLKWQMLPVAAEVLPQ